MRIYFPNGLSKTIYDHSVSKGTSLTRKTNGIVVYLFNI
uniref:Uncharacterized protein n=1 Tax=Anguilla anguilla TaxID=7936 RepID=A0A0E9VD90_ANGAN